VNLHEYQAKEILARYGVPVSTGEVVRSPVAAREAAERLGFPVVIKAQVLVGGRGKAGGVRLAHTPAEAEEYARQILSLTIRGEAVRKVLVAPAVEIQQELYLGLVLDRAARGLTLMASAAGGMDIEEVARTAPEKIARVTPDPFLGLRDYQVRRLAAQIGLPTTLWRDFTAIGQALWRTARDCDATLVEINPLALTPAGALVAVDAKIVLDDNALFRHPDLEALRDLEAENPLERQAREAGLSYIKLDGTIGCVVNGAGLAMATMDIVKLYGGAPANFLDIGGGARAERVAAALRLLFSDPQVKAVLVNIFGGITRCDEVARGIVTVLQERGGSPVPLVVRLVGTNEEEGRRILAQANVVWCATLREAAQKVVELQAAATAPRRP
jgi:succinyl-CoA synthetase beta subunit